MLPVYLPILILGSESWVNVMLCELSITVQVSLDILHHFPRLRLEIYSIVHHI